MTTARDPDALYWQKQPDAPWSASVAIVPRTPAWNPAMKKRPHRIAAGTWLLLACSSAMAAPHDSPESLRQSLLEANSRNDAAAAQQLLCEDEAETEVLAVFRWLFARDAGTRIMSAIFENTPRCATRRGVRGRTGGPASPVLRQVRQERRTQSGEIDRLSLREGRRHLLFSCPAVRARGIKTRYVRPLEDTGFRRQQLPQYEGRWTGPSGPRGPWAASGPAGSAPAASRCGASITMVL